MPMTFNWNPKTECSQVPEECDSIITTEEGKALVVSDETGNFERELISDEYPAIPISLSASSTKLRTGSSKSPIRLPKLLRQSGGSIQSIMTQRSDGTLVSWKPVKKVYPRKIVVMPNGNLIDEHDVNSRIFEYACVANLSDASHVAMATEFVDCDGVTRLRQVFVDKNDFLSDLLNSGIATLNIDKLSVTENLTVEDLEVDGDSILESLTVGGGQKVTKILKGSLSAGGVSVPSGGMQLYTIPVVGAAVGDPAFVSWQYSFGAGLVCVNTVAGADSVITNIYNPTGSTVVLAAINVYAVVFKF